MTDKKDKDKFRIISPAKKPAALSPELRLREEVDSYTTETAKATVQRFRQSLQESKRQGDQKKVGWAYLQIAMVFRGQHQYDPAQELLEKAKDIFGLLRHNLGLATVFLELSLVNRELDRNALALEYGHQSIKMFQELGMTGELAWAYDNMSTIRFNMFQRHESLTFAKKARAIFMEYGSDIGLAWNACNLAVLYRGMGFFSQADQFFSEALKIFTQLDHKQGIGWSLLGLGTVHKAQCKFDSAESLLFKAKNVFKALELKDREGWCLLTEAALKRSVGNNEDAVLINKRGIQLFSPIRNHDGVAWALFQIGQIFRDRGQLIKAWQTQREALNLHTDIANKQGMGWDENESGRIYLDLNDVSHARECFIRSKVLAEQLDEGPLKVEVDKNMARLNIDEGLLQKASGLLEQSTTFCQHFEAREVELEIYLERARLALIIGEYEKAKDWQDAAEAVLENNSLHRYKPAFDVLLAEILANQGKVKSAASVLQEALQLANKYQQRRQRAEALLGLIQLVGKGQPAAQLNAMLSQMDKDVKVLSSRKLRAKFLFVRGLLSLGDSDAGAKLMTQSLQILEAAGLSVVERQLLEMLCSVYKRSQNEREGAACQEKIKSLLEKGSVDLYLVRPRHEMLGTLPVSLTS